MSGYLIKDTTKKKNVRQLLQNPWEIFLQPVTAAVPESWKCIRHTLMERRNSGRLIWNSMPGM